MIIRRVNKVSMEADEVLFTISYTISDVKRWLVDYVRTLHHSGYEDYTHETESSLRYFLENAPLCHLPCKYAQQLSKWIVATGLRKNFLSQSANDEKLLLFSESIIKKALTGGKD